jgi:hypothetical protein
MLGSLRAVGATLVLGGADSIALPVQLQNGGDVVFDGERLSAGMGVIITANTSTILGNRTLTTAPVRSSTSSATSSWEPQN